MALALMPLGHKSRGEALWQRSNKYRRLDDLPRAEADLQRLAELDLDLPRSLQPVAAWQCNKLALRHVTGGEKQRNAHKALPLAEKAVKLSTKGSIYRNC